MRDKERIQQQELDNYNRAIDIFNSLFKEKPIYKQMPEFSVSDMRMQYHTNKYNIELKSRGTSIYEYNEQPLKVKKYINLMKDTKEDETLLYVAEIEDGYYYIWNLSDIAVCDMRLDNMWSNKQQFNIGGSNKICEPYFFLTLDSACCKGHLPLS